MNSDVLVANGSPSHLEDLQNSMEVEETPGQLIYSEDLEKCKFAVSRIKNSVIGSNRQKGSALKQGILPRILFLVGDKSIDIGVRQEACVILGSIVKGTEEHVRAIVEAKSVSTLISVLHSGDEKLIEYSLNCLTTIYSFPFAPIELIYDDPSLIPHLLTLMDHSVSNQISITTIFSNVVLNEGHQNLLCKYGVITSLAKLLVNPNPKVIMPIITCYTVLAYKNEGVSESIVKSSADDKPIPDILITLIARDRPIKMQLTVARCLTYLYRSGGLTSTDPKISLKTLPCLVRMCGKEHDFETRITGAESLAYLIEVDKELQAIAAVSNHLIPTLADFLNYQPISKITGNSGNANQMVQAGFRAFASLAANDEEIRKKIIETQSLMDRVVVGLEDSNESVALAALRCLHSLSRSVHQLRTAFKDHTVWNPLMKLVQSSNQEILNVASSTLCNLILEFSPSKDHLLEAGAVEILCNLTRSEDSGLRLNGIWALMNVAFQADQRVKSQIITALGTDQIFRLLSDEQVKVVIKTLGLLRNLLSAPHIDAIMNVYGKQIMQATILILEGDHEPEVKEQALCLLANVADGFSAKSFIMTNEDVLKKITNYLVHANSNLQIAAVVCVSNLATKDEEGSMDRQAKLKEMGVQKLLHQLITTSDQHLFERVKTALNQFSPN